MKCCWLLSALIFTACTTTDSDSEAVSTDESDLYVALPNDLPIPDAAGVASTWSTAGRIDLNNDFFRDYGTNGRNCGSCHAPTEGWTVTPAGLRLRFALTGGTDPIFRPVDGATSPNADVSTEHARRTAYRMLLDRGTIRVGEGVPANAEFELVAVDDPYGYASAQELSLFRRPLPSTNLTLMSTVMWDGRVTGSTVHDALAAQADGATEGHAQAASALPSDANASIVEFESALFTAQRDSFSAGRLDAAGAEGTARDLAQQPFEPGAFTLFDAWANSPKPQRRAIYRGQVLFNTRTRATGGGSCNACHNARNAGASTTGFFADVGVSSAERRTDDLPLYTLRNKTTGELVQTTDPGRALVTGRWRDIGRFKVPMLRGLATRAPYFHNGSAATLLDVVKTYESSLGFSFTPDEEADLVAFLSAL